MIYRDDTHKELFERWTQQTHTERDPEYSALFYLLAMDDVTRKHIDSIFDFTKHSIKPRGLLSAAWQTSTSRKTVRLALNLFNGIYSDMGGDDEPFPRSSVCYSPFEIFACSYAPYYVQALRIRYPEYFRG